MSQADPDKDSAAVGSVANICPNCHSLRLGRFCASCGQPADGHRRKVGSLLGEFVVDLFSFDSRVLRTVYALLLRPGELARAFREGRTQSYVPSVRLYMFVSLIFFLMLAYGNIAIAQFGLTVLDKKPPAAAISVGEKGAQTITVGSKAAFFAPLGVVKSDLSPEDVAALHVSLNQAFAEAGQKPSSWMDRAVLRAIDKLANDPAALNEAISLWLPRALFLLLPLFALVLTLFYIRQRKLYLFVDHLVFSLNFHSFLFVVVLAESYLSRGVTDGGASSAMLIAALFVLIGYLALAMRTFYRQSWLMTATKSVAVAASYAIFVLLPAFVGVLAMGVFYG